MDPLDKTCSRCAQGGMVMATNISCPSCGKDNSNRRHACVHCHERLGAPLANIQKQPLRDYQSKSAELAKAGDAARALALLREAVDFYPDDVKTRTVLINVLERMGKDAEAQQNQEHILLLSVRNSEEFARQQGDAAFNAGNFDLAVKNFEQGLRYHPHSTALHEGLAAALDCTGDSTKAHTQRTIATRLKSQQIEVQQQRYSQSNQTAHTAETAAMVGGTVVGATGAAVGGAITIVSLISGILVAMLGVGLCIASVFLFLTCIGFPLAILCILAGFSLIATGFTMAIGGAAAGASAGCMGIFTGMLVNGTALMHRNSRRR